MFRPPDSSESARLQGGNARQRGPFERKIWVNVTVRGLEDIHNTVSLSLREGAYPFYHLNDVSGGRGVHHMISGSASILPGGVTISTPMSELYIIVSIY